MSSDHQKNIFANNLNYYLNIEGKQQKEVAEAIGENISTFNTWCNGKSMPRMDKIQKLADYFEIGKSDLVEERSESDPRGDARILADMGAMELAKIYKLLSKKDRESLMRLAKALFDTKGTD